VLKTVQATGLIAMALVAPNVVGAMGRMGLLPSSRQQDVIKRASRRLVQTGMLEWKSRKLRLTRKGEKKLRELSLRQQVKNKTREWDGKWRVLVFDIPERKKVQRKKLRLTLIDIGFHRLQDSVWIYPFDCEDLIQLIKADFRVGDEVRYMIVDSIERDKSLRDLFKL
jgi:CRISPR-associated endonuclease Cas2